MFAPRRTTNRLLGRLGGRARVGALARAISSPTDPSSTAAAAELLRLADRERKRAGAAALTALVSRWAGLGPENRRAIIAAASARWSVIVQSLAADPDPIARRALALLAAACPDPAIISAVPALLVDADPTVAEEAERALLATARTLVDLTEVSQDAAADAIARAAAAFADHRRRGVAGALAIALTRPRFGAPGGPFNSIMADEGHPIHAELRTVIRRSTEPESRMWAWVLLKHPTLAPACLARLAQRDDLGATQAVLERSHLIVNPDRQQAIAGMSHRVGSQDSPGLMPGAAIIPHLSGTARLGLVDWSAAVMSGEPRADLLSPLASDPSPGVRHRLIGAAGAGDASLRLDLCFDPVDRVARSALIASLDDIRPGGRGWRVDRAWAGRAIESLTRSPHGAVRRIARQAAARLDPRRADDAGARLAAKRRLRQDRDGLITELRELLAHRDPERVVGALALVRCLGVEAELEAELAGLATGDGRDDRARATAAGLLGRLSSAGAVGALRGCLDGEDQRTRANAVDAFVALARRDPDAAVVAAAIMVELKDDPHHRVRANSVRGLIACVGSQSEAVGAQAMGAMLGDDRPMHRVAGLWLAERTGAPGFWARWGDLAGRIAAVAASDPEPAVRDRAGRAARAVMARIRVGWTSRAG